MDADGSDPTNLTSSAEIETYVTWSPDGERVAFARDGAIWAVPVDGGDAVDLTSSTGLTASNPLYSVR